MVTSSNNCEHDEATEHEDETVGLEEIKEDSLGADPSTPPEVTLFGQTSEMALELLSDWAFSASHRCV